MKCPNCDTENEIGGACGCTVCKSCGVLIPCLPADMKNIKSDCFYSGFAEIKTEKDIRGTMADFDVIRVCEFNLELLGRQVAEAKTVEEQNKILAEIEEAKKDLENARKAVDRT